MPVSKGAAAVVAVVGLFGLGACSSSGRAGTKAPPHTSTTSTSTSTSSITVAQSSTTATSVPATVASKPSVSGPPGGPVPTGVTPVSVTFDSPTEGFVLAGAACSTPPCTSILRTRDSGRSWVGIPAPRGAISSNGVSGQPVAGGVRGIRFASALDGWTFGPALYATHDGGATWHPVSLPGTMEDLQASAGQAFALIGACTPSTGTCDSPQVTLWHTDAAADAWTQVPGVTGLAARNPIVLHGASGWVVLEDAAHVDQVFFTSDGHTWSRAANPCPANTTLDSIAAGSTTVGYLCVGQPASGTTTKQLLTSSDQGRTTQVAGMAPSAGDGGALVALSPTAWVLASSSAASLIYRSSDGGRTWPSPVTYLDGGLGFGDFGFTTPTQGVAIHGPAHDSAQLIISRDGGATWNPVTF
ncbi:MAG: hypothetical protein M3083_21770 [Actinomycetota bacterium]|nr:hypothetical protein [Actinomycetota bacterium]